MCISSGCARSAVWKITIYRRLRPPACELPNPDWSRRARCTRASKQPCIRRPFWFQEFEHRRAWKIDEITLADGKGPCAAAPPRRVSAKGAGGDTMRKVTSSHPKRQCRRSVYVISGMGGWLSDGPGLGRFLAPTTELWSADRSDGCSNAAGLLRLCAAVHMTYWDAAVDSIDARAPSGAA